MDLTPAMQKFILHWGEMGARWGVNRTVAQVHALLYLAGRPLDAEEITQTLNVARSNVSNSLKELQGWGIVKAAHQLGSRREHFTALQDPWEMAVTIMRERKQREFDPTLQVLRECTEQAKASRSTADAHAAQRMSELLGLLEQVDRWYHHVFSLPHAALVRFVRMGKHVPKWLGVAG